MHAVGIFEVMADTGVNPRPAIMFVDAETDPRNHVPRLGNERETLLSQLQWLRQSMLLKCENLGPEDLARRAVPPSTMSLIGIVRHLAEVERRWFHRWMAGIDIPPHFYGPDNPEGDFDGAVADPAVIEESFRIWREEAEFADKFTLEAADLDIVGNIEYQGPVNLREVLVHVIQEHARHVGHADLLREVIDGKIGI
jgi:uncharacterized damage-inducible protein DinB